MNPTLIEAKNKTMYATDTVNVRTFPNRNFGKCTTIDIGTKVKVINRFNKKWYQVLYEGKVRYISSSYLTKKKNYKTYNAPNHNNFKSYEDFRCITSKSSPQYKLKSQYEIEDNGLCTVDGRYCIAMGSYYTKKIGTKIDLTLEYKGKKYVLPCILADQKADKDTNSTHQIHNSDGSLVEFIVDTHNLHRKIKLMGNVSYGGKRFMGKVKKIAVFS